MDDPQMATHHAKFEEARIDRIETVIDKLANTQVEDRSRLSRIESMIETLGSAHGATQREIRSLAETVNSHGKLNTATVMAMVAVAGLLITIGKLWTDPTNTKLDQHLALPGHTEAMTIHAANTERFTTIDNQLAQSVKTEERLRDRIDEKDDEVASLSARITAIESSRVDTNRIVSMEKAIAEAKAYREIEKHNAMMQILTEIRDKVTQP